ncbi:protein tweety-like [Pecten maximus]|uniref:protein tweety-like n=1 Tax=Pecten maximus TaxID=6579 RepID=UPI001458EAA3|nr:protein tweety-like [Pecten maximus]
MKEPTLSTHYSGESDVSTVESKPGLDRVPPDPCRNDCDPTTAATEVGPGHDAMAAAKIQEFKQEMERIIAGRDVPKSSHMDVPNSERSVESIVAKSLLRPSVPSFYPGFKKVGTADHGNEHVTDGKTSTNNRTTRPPPGIAHQHGSQIHPNWAHVQFNAGHIPAGNFQTHHAASRTDHGQKPFDFRSTLTNPRTCNQPPALNKLQMQPTQAAAAALIMANCLQQPSRRDVTCNPQPAPQNKPYNDFQPPPRYQQYQQHYGHIGVQNPYQGNTARNPPPGFNETPQAPVRNREHAAFRSEQVHQQHPIPLQQQLAFRFSAEQSFQHPQQQPNIGNRFTQPQVQNLHQHQLAQQQQHQQNQQQNQHQPQHHPHNHQHQQQYRPLQQPHRLPHQPHPPLHPLQPQQHFLNPEGPSIPVLQQDTERVATNYYGYARWLASQHTNGEHKLQQRKCRSV